MLRGDRQVALHAAAVVCQDTGERYRHAAELMDGTPLGRLFAELARERTESARRLAAAMRARGERPDVPDAEWETVERMVTRARAAARHNLQHVLIEEAQAAEGRLIAAIEEALALGQPADLEEMLRSLAQQAAEGARRVGRHER